MSKILSINFKYMYKTVAAQGCNLGSMLFAVAYNEVL